MEKKFNVGDRVRILPHSYYSMHNPGEVGVVVSISLLGRVEVLVKDRLNVSQYHHPECLEHCLPQMAVYGVARLTSDDELRIAGHSRSKNGLRTFDNEESARRAAAQLNRGAREPRYCVVKFEGYHGID